ncbi:hypothetical protein [Chromobacterium vaccinii]|uniref:hypothetical protein n=1 Tax=Chromobacterium vaccinii TaxID=1108595 RepID=UPI0011AB4E02|nr:hypothetical protein [Chromobacterium vaccinii]
MKKFIPLAIFILFPIAFAHADIAPPVSGSPAQTEMHDILNKVKNQFGKTILSKCAKEVSSAQCRVRITSTGIHGNPGHISLDLTGAKVSTLKCHINVDQSNEPTEITCGILNRYLTDPLEN